LNLSDYFVGDNIFYDLPSLGGVDVSLDNSLLSISSSDVSGWFDVYVFALENEDLLRSNVFRVWVLENSTLMNKTNLTGFVNESILSVLESDGFVRVLVPVDKREHFVKEFKDISLTSKTKFEQINMNSLTRFSVLKNPGRKISSGLKKSFGGVVSSGFSSLNVSENFSVGVSFDDVVLDVAHRHPVLALFLKVGNLVEVRAYLGGKHCLGCILLYHVLVQVALKLFGLDVEVYDPVLLPGAAAIVFCLVGLDLLRKHHLGYDPYLAAVFL